MAIRGTQVQSTTPAEDSAVVALFERACRGDRPAFGQIVRLYQDRLFTTVLRLIGQRDEAIELTQEAFTRALAALPNFRGDSAPYTWLCKIATNLTLDRLRRKVRRPTFSLNGSDGAKSNGSSRDQAAGLIERMRQSGPGPAETLDLREQAEQVVAALGRLDPDYRVLVVLRDVDGLDYQQMATVLDMPLGTLKSRLFRARVALREELKAYMT